MSDPVCIINNLPSTSPQLIHPSPWDTTDFLHKITCYDSTKQYLDEWKELIQSFLPVDSSPKLAPDYMWKFGEFKTLDLTSSFRPARIMPFTSGVPLKITPSLDLHIDDIVAVYPPDDINDLFWLGKVTDVNLPMFKLRWYQVIEPHCNGDVNAKYYLDKPEENEMTIAMVIRKIRITNKNQIHKRDYKLILSNITI